MANFTQNAPQVINGTQASITAGTTQTQAGATTITSTFAPVGTVAVDNDGAILPAGWPLGGMVLVSNQDAAQDIKLYPNVGGTINGAAANAALVVGQQQQAMCFQTDASDGLTWICVLGAVATPA